MTGKVFDARSYSIPGENAAFCLDCGCFFSIDNTKCPRCTSETFVSAAKLMNAIAKAAPMAAGGKL